MPLGEMLFSVAGAAAAKGVQILAAFRVETEAHQSTGALAEAQEAWLNLQQTHNLLEELVALRQV